VVHENTWLAIQTPTAQKDPDRLFHLRSALAELSHLKGEHNSDGNRSQTMHADTKEDDYTRFLELGTILELGPRARQQR
jgi:hypothetical protein